MIPRYTTKNFRDALLNLLPMGPIWSRAEGSLCWFWAGVLGESYARNSDRALELLKVAFPQTATELLPEWEQTLGLPDDCVGTVSDVSLRQQLVVDRLVSSVNSSVSFYEMYARKYFGIAINITQYTPFRFGTTFGRPLYGQDWGFAWNVASAQQNLGVLPCIFNRIAPAHTVVIYGSFPKE